MVTVRFAPSPTGFLHIGGARTALFNWLYAKHEGGRFLLRIEDTDRERSTAAAVDAIYDGLRWLGLHWDGEPVSQFARRERHRAVADALLAAGHAYRCYASKEELDAMRAQAKAEGKPLRYDGRWRDRDPTEAPQGVDPVIRLKAPQQGETVIEDRVQGRVTVANSQLDDMVLLRADGTPTYMLAVVVDDHDMGISHVIRGDDHLTNSFRQAQIYAAMGWDLPVFAHIPLIHGPDGAKLSKRHGALGVEAYRDMGYLPEAMRNYLLRLGWSHGDDEIIPTEQAIAWFGLDAIGKAAARFDFAKLESLNAHYMRNMPAVDLLPALRRFLPEATDEVAEYRIAALLPEMTQRAKTLVELADSAGFLIGESAPLLTEKAAKLLDPEGCAALAAYRDSLAALTPFEAEALEQSARQLAEDKALKLGKIAQPFRAALTGSTVSPPIFAAAAALGRDTVLRRIDDAISQ